MTANGFLEQRTARPVSFGAVVLLHGAAIAAVLLLKGPGWIQAVDPPLVVKEVKLAPPPPEIPPTLLPDKPLPQVPTISRFDVPPRVIPTPVPNIAATGPAIVEPSTPTIGTNPGPAAGTAPVREAVTASRSVRSPAGAWSAHSSTRVSPARCSALPGFGGAQRA
jgi:hypothetical protein